jgi:3-hydroxybutyryl-CoA dehydratase
MIPDRPSSQVAAIQEGLRASHRYAISQDIYEHFLAAYHDTNPLHTDGEFARRHGFADRVMHGMILQGFISHFVGVHFPGGRSLLQSVSTQFKAPCHLGDEILIEATVTQVAEAVKVIIMEMVLTNVTQGRVAAKSKVQVGLL